MSRTAMIMFIAGALLLAGVMALLSARRDSGPLTGRTGADATEAASSRIGRSALSHGGPAPTKDEPASRTKNEGRRSKPGRAMDRPSAEAAGPEGGQQ
ncbi:MAG TPA: hypothetical protein VGQ60_04680 [Nitrospiraceae bacterium]|nr:hypothetical protein [Nitrospiraceae bacterium]